MELWVEVKGMGDKAGSIIEAFGSKKQGEVVGELCSLKKYYSMGAQLNVLVMHLISISIGKIAQVLKDCV